MNPVDLRSDTVTRPTPAMRAAIAEAPVGDDVFGDDELTLELEAEVASILAMEAALFVPSGTMANQLALAVLTSPGDEVLLEETSHIFQYEGGAPALLSGVQLWPIVTERGVPSVEQIRSRVRPVDSHFPVTRLLCLENTHNRGGGRVLDAAEVRAAEYEAKAHGLAVHVDGARLWNAAVSAGCSEAELVQGADTVSVCFSKGLGAPIGSALAGTSETIRVARHFRKRFGGGMRQVGILAAAALHALRHHRERIGEDHRGAKRIAEGIAGLHGLRCEPSSVETNIVVAEVKAHTPAIWLDELEAAGVRAVGFGNDAIRFVTHLDVSSEQIDAVIHALARVDEKIGR